MKDITNSHKKCTRQESFSKHTLTYKHKERGYNGYFWIIGKERKFMSKCVFEWICVPLSGTLKLCSVLKLVEYTYLKYGMLTSNPTKWAKNLCWFYTYDKVGFHQVNKSLWKSNCIHYWTMAPYNYSNNITLTYYVYCMPISIYLFGWANLWC